MRRNPWTVLLVLLLLAASATAQQKPQLEFKNADPLGWKAPGDLPPLDPATELVIEKVMPSECRWVLGHCMNPVDGRIDSYQYRGARYTELSIPHPHGFNSAYSYQKNPGCHIDLADARGFNYLYIRGGFCGMVYTGVDADDGPGNGTKVLDVRSPRTDVPEGYSRWLQSKYMSAYRFARVQTNGTIPGQRFSFFWNVHACEAGGGLNTNLSDVGFFRTGAAVQDKMYASKTAYALGQAVPMPADLAPHFNENPRRDARFTFGKQTFAQIERNGKGASLPLNPMQGLNLITEALPAGTPVSAMRLTLDLRNVPAGSKLLIIIQDPLNRSQELMRLDFVVKRPGVSTVLLDFPDQIIPAKSRKAFRVPASKNNGRVVLIPHSKRDAFDVLEERFNDLQEKREKLKEIKDKEERNKLWRETNDAIRQVGKDIVTLVDTPETDAAKPVPGRPMWVTLVSENAATLGPATRVELLATDAETAGREHHAYRALMLKGYFSMLAESRPWMGKTYNFYSFPKYWSTDERGKDYARPMSELYETLLELHALYPDDDIVTQYFRWFHMNWLPRMPIDELPSLPEIAGVPHWAVLLDRSNRKLADAVWWWINNRRASNGEFGGSVNDDTCLMPWFTASALINGDLFPEVLKSDIGVAENAIKYTIAHGLNKRNNDYGHGYEDGTNQLSLMPVIAYGNPRYVEQVMVSSSTLEKIAPMTPGGYRRFIPHDSKNTFGANLLKAKLPDDPNWWKDATQNNTSAVSFHPMLMLAWYNHHPRAIKILQEFGDGTENWRRCGGYNSGGDFAFGLYMLTGDKKYLLPTFTDRNSKEFKFTLTAKGGSFADYINHGDYRERPWWPGVIKNKWSFRNAFLEGWAATLKRDYLEEGLTQVLWGLNNSHSIGGVERYFHILTSAEMFTDRIFLPNQLTSQAYLGGTMERNKFWPSYAISWEGFDKDFAAIVLAQSKTTLKVAAINLAEEPRRGRFRVWLLDHGMYELTIGPDANDDGEIDNVTLKQQIELQRMDGAVDVDLAPRRLTVYSLTQTKKLDSIYERTDLAISADDIEIGKGPITVTVHNIGIAPSPASTVALLDAQGKVVSEASVPAIEAPLDFTARTANVTLKPVAGAVRVVLDPQNRVPELTELNNSVQLTGKTQ